ncbi:MAG: cob(I)yrinic acid a,c-diamide adenosyltransferase [Candidatus Aenigmarchaeota archaeon]|nr:cob(I)yrinic acid a,c-diamide adenosyltransferase [Candidatus Aenigmarchaeota archaeon]
MKDYTHHFDSGNTYIFSGKSVSKASPLVEAFGEVDELNSLLGLAAAEIADREARDIIRGIQMDLLTIGADLANPSKKLQPLDPQASTLPSRIIALTEKEVRGMERLIQKFEKELPPLKNFILPSGTRGAATLHVARAVARRVERRIVAAKDEHVNLEVLKYFNRLSDFLFYLARVVNKREGGKEEVWK